MLDRHNTAPQHPQRTHELRKAFLTALEAFIQSEDEHPDAEHVSSQLHRAAGGVWNDTGRMPELVHHDVRDAIANWVDADAWMKSGAKYSVAARLIRSRLSTAKIQNG